jgi:hypothetical protein
MAVTTTKINTTRRVLVSENGCAVVSNIVSFLSLSREVAQQQEQPPESTGDHTQKEI